MSWCVILAMQVIYSDSEEFPNLGTKAESNENKSRRELFDKSLTEVVFIFLTGYNHLPVICTKISSNIVKVKAGSSSTRDSIRVGMHEFHKRQRSLYQRKFSSKTLPLWNLYFHSPAVNTTSFVIQD